MIRAASIALCLAVLSSASAQQSCRKLTFDGQIARGEPFNHAITRNLNFSLTPVASGWRIEVQATGSKSAHDAAEVATPPYQSVNPLLLTTDYGFRAQDAVSWNPRDFQFVTDAETLSDASRDEDALLSGKLSPAQKSALASRLIEVTRSSAHGQLRILDASLVPGTADQSPVAASVASHWRTTPHTLVQPRQGSNSSPLGTVVSLKFEVTLWLPEIIAVAPGLHAVAAPCPR